MSRNLDDMEETTRLDLINETGWANFITWAFEQPQMREVFEASCNCAFPRNEIEDEIDRATGNDLDLLSRFIVYMTIEHWGLEHAPRVFKEWYHENQQTYDRSVGELPANLELHEDRRGERPVQIEPSGDDLRQGHAG